MRCTSWTNPRFSNLMTITTWCQIIMSYMISSFLMQAHELYVTHIDVPNTYLNNSQSSVDKGLPYHKITWPHMVHCCTWVLIFNNPALVIYMINLCLCFILRLIILDSSLQLNDNDSNTQVRPYFHGIQPLNPTHGLQALPIITTKTTQ
jgi:hypothetical protein